MPQAGNPQQALELAEETINALLEATEALVCVLQPDGRILACNEPYARIHERRPEELIGVDATQLMPLPRREAFV